MLRPFLILGVGGSGGKTVRGLRHALTLRLEQSGWRSGIPKAWQIIHVDTPVAQDGTDYVMPFIPAEDYRGLAAAGASYESVVQSIVHGQRLSGDALNNVKRMLPDASRVPVDVTKGAGQFRAVGRAVALSKLADIERMASNAVNRMNDATALGELASLGETLGSKLGGGVTPNPTVIVISSIAGGSGAGQYLDVIEAVKANVKTLPWAHQFFALLYAPDVFDQVKGSAGIPSNALATVSETMNGFWTRDPSPSTVELFRSMGLSPSYGAARDRVGAAYPLIVGRSNSRVAFDNQGEVYSAVSTSLAAWMTDDKVQDDLDAYATGNWTANVGADVLPDATRLMRPLDQAPPFSALGFGRVTLGRDKFLDYATERFTRSHIDRMLFAHIEEDPRFEVRTDDEWIEFRKDQAFEGFIREIGLDEETEDRNDIIDAVRPDSARKLLEQEFRNAVFENSAVGLDKTGGLDLSSWHDRLLLNREDRIGSFIAQDTVNLSRKMNEWVEAAPERIIDSVELAIARYGIPVTVAILGDLSRTLRAAQANLLQESEKYRGYVQRLSSYVHDDLGHVANQESIRSDQDAVQNAVDHVAQSFDWECEANLREVVSALVGELHHDFIDPLRQQLSGARTALLQRVSDRLLQDGRENDYDSWPRRVGSAVPRKFSPAPNERLLVPHTQYPAEFQRLVSQTFGNRKFEDSILDVISELARGVEIPGSRDDQWSTIELRRSWKPRTTGDRQQRAASASTPQFRISDDPADYAARAHRWMLRKGTPFDAYIRANLTDFFNADEVDPGEFKRRKDAFREGFTAALGTSEPLVRLNPQLLSEVHGKSIGEGTRLVFSSIPFSEGSEMYQIAKTALTQAGLWDENVSRGWFKDAKVDSIDVFAMAGFPFQPVVMDSIMAPIARGWLADSGNPDSRTAFWKWKRARLLREAVPADPEVFDQMLRGWYVAKALGWLAVEKDPAKGPKLGVWDAGFKAMRDFPHPLLYPGNAPARDFPGAVLESLIIALPLVNAEGSLRPLRAYHALLDLGGSQGHLSDPMADWLRDGKLPESAPTPNPERAGSRVDSLVERQSAVRAFMDGEIAEFEDQIVKQDTRSSVYSYPVTWEIRDSVSTALRELRDAVLDLKPEVSGI